MGITYVSGDILEAKTDAVVNPVNCVGFMGAGLAFDFGEKYPDMLKDYRQMCRRRVLQPGLLHIYETRKGVPPVYIINFPTKHHWRSPSELRFIESGLQTLVQVIGKIGIKSLSVPKLGCGLGRLNWRDVNILFRVYFSNINAEVMVYGEDV